MFPGKIKILKVDIVCGQVERVVLVSACGPAAGQPEQAKRQAPGCHLNQRLSIVWGRVLLISVSSGALLLGWASCMHAC